MKLKVKEVANLTGISVRTLHYYDQIGLLPPSDISEAGYRIYDDQALETLQQILFFKELDFPLADIKQMMASPHYDKAKALERHKALLMQKRSRLDRLIALVDHTLKGDIKMDFQAFDMTEITANKQKYADEVKARWGETDAYQACTKKTASYGQADWERINNESVEILSAFAAIRTTPPDSEQAAQLVERWQAHITQYYYPCSNEILAGLGLMYQEDERFAQNIDRHGTGTVSFIAAAIEIYCSK